MRYQPKVILPATIFLLQAAAHAFITSSSPTAAVVKKGHNDEKNTSIFAAEENYDNVNAICFDVGVHSIPGVDWQRPGKINQDSYFIDDQIDSLFFI